MAIRITLGPIESLTADKPDHIGSISLKRKSSNSDILVVNFHYESREIRMGQEIPHFDWSKREFAKAISERASRNFIGYVERWLEDEKLYVAHADFRPYKCGSIIGVGDILGFCFARGEQLNGEAYKELVK